MTYLAPEVWFKFSCCIYVLRHIHIQYAIDMANFLAHRLLVMVFLCGCSVLRTFSNIHSSWAHRSHFGWAQSSLNIPKPSTYWAHFVRSRCLGSPSLVPCTEWICCDMQHCASMSPFIARVLGAGAYDSIRKLAKYSFARVGNSENLGWFTWHSRFWWMWTGQW